MYKALDTLDIKWWWEEEKKKQLLTKEHWLMVHFRNPLMHSYHQAKQPFLDCDVPELGGDIIKTLRVIPRD